MLLEKLIELKDHLNSAGGYQTSYGDGDGRTESLLKEQNVLWFLEKYESNITLPEINRSFGDFYITDDGVEYPVNLKIISRNNNSCNNLVGTPSLMNYIFFGSNSRITQQELSRKLSTVCIDDTNQRDYGFLVLEKESGLFSVATMLTMRDYVTNPSNGFQANFNAILLATDTSKENKEYLLRRYEELLFKKATPYLQLKGLL